MPDQTLYLRLADHVYSTPEVRVIVEPTPDMVASVLETLRNALNLAHVGSTMPDIEATANG